MTEMVEVQATLQVLRIVAYIIGVLSFLGPFAIGALLWKLSKTFVTQKDFDGLGSRLTAYETFSIQTRERVDHAHERIERGEAALTVKLDWIRRDLDQLLRVNLRYPAREDDAHHEHGGG